MVDSALVRLITRNSLQMITILELLEEKNIITKEEFNKKYSEIHKDWKEHNGN